VAEGRQRNRGFFSAMVRGVSNAREGLKILIFLSRPPLVCSSLLHRRSSWKGDSQKFAGRGFSELLHRPENWYILAGYASLPRRRCALDVTTKVG
jgi:hypothetical protein